MSTNSNGTAIGNSIPLFLTAKEAKVLNYILCQIGGSPFGSRGHAEKIRQKLIKQSSRFSKVDISVQKDFSVSQDAITNTIYLK